MMGKLSVLALVGLLMGSLPVIQTAPQITGIQTSYPIESDGVDEWINVPNDSTQLTIHVNALHTDRVQFYATNREPDSMKQLICEDRDASDGFTCVMRYHADDGFSRQIIIDAISPNGTKTSKSIIVNKSL